MNTGSCYISSNRPTTKRSSKERTSVSFNMNSVSIDEYEKAMKTIRSLEADLLQLQEVSRKKLKKSRKEMESLKEKCTLHVDITNQLENDVVEAKNKESYWHKRCLDAEFELLQNNYKTSDENMTSCTSSMSSDSTNEPIEIKSVKDTDSHTKKEDRGSTSCSLSETSKDSSSTNSLCSLLRVSWRKGKDQDSELKQNNTSDLSSEQYYVETCSQEAKLADRESAIRSLEQTIEHHVKAMHTMQAEMECMVETLKAKEKKTQETHRQKEKFLEEQLSNLEHNIKKKSKVAASQEKQIDAYKNYTEELTTELTRVLKVVKAAKRNGVNLERFERQ